MAAPTEEPSCCSSAHWKDKPLDKCMWCTVVMGIVTGLVGVVCLGIGATGWAGTLLGAVMILLGSIFAIPAVFIKCKACMITFIPLCIIFCVIGGIIVGFMGFVGAVGGAICDAFLGKESEFYTCSQSKTAALGCKGRNSYITGGSIFGCSMLSRNSCNTCNDCRTKASGAWCRPTGGSTAKCINVFSSCGSGFTKITSTSACTASDKKTASSASCSSQSGGNKACCDGMVAAGKKSCVTKQQSDECKKSKATHTAGFIGVIGAILGCVTTCVACCTCCGKNAFFSNDPVVPAGGAPVQVQPAQTVQVATSTTTTVAK